MSRSNHVPLDFGPFPIDQVHRTLKIELEPGHTHLSANAQKHAARRHPQDFGICLPHVAQVITDPHYMRDDFQNPGKIELISRVPALGEHLLVAVDIAPDSEGRYNVVSFYPVGAQKVADRLDKRHLKRVIK